MAASITPGSRRAQAQKFIVSGLRLGLPGTQILEQLQLGGLGYNKTQFSQDLARLRAGTLPRAAPAGSLTHLVSFEGSPIQLITRGEPRYQYVFEARVRNSLGQFTASTLTWSFTSPNLLIPDIAAGIGIALAPDVNGERYGKTLSDDSVPISPGDVYMYDSPFALGGSE